MSAWKDISTFDFSNDYQDFLIKGQDGVAVACWDADAGYFVADLRGKGNGQYVYGPVSWMKIPD